MEELSCRQPEPTQTDTTRRWKKHRKQTVHIISTNLKTLTSCLLFNLLTQVPQALLARSPASPGGGPFVPHPSQFESGAGSAPRWADLACVRGALTPYGRSVSPWSFVLPSPVHPRPRSCASRGRRMSPWSFVLPSPVHPPPCSCSLANFLHSPGMGKGKWFELNPS